MHQWNFVNTKLNLTLQSWMLNCYSGIDVMRKYQKDCKEKLYISHPEPVYAKFTISFKRDIKFQTRLCLALEQRWNLV